MNFLFLGHYDRQFLFLGCYDQLGVEDGSIVSDGQLSASDFADSNHKAADGRLNGPRGWMASPVEGAFYLTEGL